MRIFDKTQQGMTLVEVMVSIAVGTILLAGVLNIVSNNKKIFNAHKSLSRLKENGRYARYILQQDIRMAGFQGCNNTRVIKPNNQIGNPSAAQTFDNTNMIMGYQAIGSNWTPNIPTWIKQNLAPGTNIVPGTDVLTVRKMDTSYVYLDNAMANPSSPISIPDRVNFTEGNLLYITDCESVDIFVASSGTDSTAVRHDGDGNSSGLLSKAYQTDAYIGRIQTFTYYVRTSGRTNRSGQAITALVRQDINGNEEVLIDGVENMRITYGVDNNGDQIPDNFLTANLVQANNAWKDVVSIRITQLLNSIDEIADSKQRFTYLGVTQSSNDRKLRRQWDTYISLRNRSL